MFQSSNDWKCDDLGSWKHNGNGYTRFAIRNGEISLINQGKAVALDETTYTLKRIYYKNKSSYDLNKYASCVVGRIYFVVILLLSRSPQNAVFFLISVLYFRRISQFDFLTICIYREEASSRSG